MPQTGIDYVTCNQANLDNLQDNKTLIFSFKMKARYERHLLRDYLQTLFLWIAKKTVTFFVSYLVTLSVMM